MGAIAAAVIGTLGIGLAATAAFADPGGMGPGMMHGPMAGGMGPGMMMHGPMAGGMQQHDAVFAADMGPVHEMLLSHDRIQRTVMNLPDGIKTVTESDDPKVAQLIKGHVASMERRLVEGREFNMFSPTLPVLFDNKEKISTVIEATDKGFIVTQTSGDAKVAAALQAHAAEVSELTRDGMAAMMRAAQASMGAPGNR